ncbi:MAG: metal ABC transporter ATP-binding protein [Limnochordia bacterium]|jgi:manganese transport system ATP-binding protein
MNGPYVELQGISVGYGQKLVLEDINWQVKRGTIAAVIGPNGGGKSTLLRTIVGNLTPRQGRVLVHGKEPKEARSQMAYLPQNEVIDWQFPITGLDVVLQGFLNRIPWWRRPGREELAVAKRVLVQVGLWEQRDEPIAHFSGGQRQRLLMARALAQNARLLLLDEPTAGLDTKAQGDFIELLQELKGEGRTVIMATHDLHCLDLCCDDVLCINGRVLYRGHPAGVLAPKMVVQVFGPHLPLSISQERRT